MAERRMFAKSIVLSDAFLDMPMSARCLYFTLGMLADDDGFVGSVKSAMRQCGASKDDLTILITKRYLISFESGVVVIKHWKLNNYIQNDRHKSTNYLDEFSLLKEDENRAYTEKKNNMYTKCIQNVYTDKNSIDKNSIDKNRKDIYTSPPATIEQPKVNPNTKKEEWFNKFWEAYPKKSDKKKAHDKFIKVCTDEIMFCTIMAGLSKTVIAKYKAENSTQYIKNPTTWLNGENWNDEPYQQTNYKKGINIQW